MIEKIVGINIKTLRSKKGLSLRELAKKIDVSPSFLSQVETGKAVPSLLTLKRLADALNTTIGNLVGETNTTSNTSPVTKKDKRRVLNHLGHRIKVELLNSEDNNIMQSYIIDFEKGGDTGMFGQHSGQEAGFILKGKVQLYYNNKIYTLDEGDAFYIKSTIPHHLKNLNNGKSIVIIVSTAPKFI